MALGIYSKGTFMHIGLIGGIGPAATDYYHRGLISRNISAGTKLDLTIAHADTRELVQNLAAGAAQQQAEIFASLIRRLAVAGAQAVAVTSMSGQFCVRELEAISPLPILKLIPVVAAAIQQRNFKKVGILGTRTVMETHLYGGIPATVEFILPEGEGLDQVHKAYVDMAISGRITDAQREVFFSVGRSLCQSRGADAVILGGTDLFLAFEGHDYGFPVLDCGGVHIDAIYRYSVGKS
ncbi:MAG TPA: aspartate/glutamate racemase family protein [Pirellulales bacterium]|jgi:aspartate racemase